MTVDNLVIADDSLELFGCGLFKTFRKSILSLNNSKIDPQMRYPYWTHWTHLNYMYYLYY